MIWRGEQAGRAVGGTGIEFRPRTIPFTAVREATKVKNCEKLAG